MYVVRSWDIAATKKKKSAYTVGIKMALMENGDFVILDMVRGKWRPKERDEIMLATAEADGQAVMILVEQQPAAAGVDFAEHLNELLTGFIVEHVNPSGDKETRASAFASAAEKNQISIFAAEWNQPLFNELENFPDGEFKDIIDACSQAFNFLARLARTLAKKQKQDETNGVNQD